MAEPSPSSQAPQTSEQVQDESIWKVLVSNIPKRSTLDQVANKIKEEFGTTFSELDGWPSHANTKTYSFNASGALVNRIKAYNFNVANYGKAKVKVITSKLDFVCVAFIYDFFWEAQFSQYVYISHFCCCFGDVDCST